MGEKPQYSNLKQVPSFSGSQILNSPLGACGDFGEGMEGMGKMAFEPFCLYRAKTSAV